MRNNTLARRRQPRDLTVQEYRDATARRMVTGPTKLTPGGARTLVSRLTSSVDLLREYNTPPTQAAAKLCFTAAELYAAEQDAAHSLMIEVQQVLDSDDVLLPVTVAAVLQAKLKVARLFFGDENPARDLPAITAPPLPVEMFTFPTEGGE